MILIAEMFRLYSNSPSLTAASVPMLDCDLALWPLAPSTAPKSGKEDGYGGELSSVT